MGRSVQRHKDLGRWAERDPGKHQRQPPRGLAGRWQGAQETENKREQERTRDRDIEAPQAKPEVLLNPRFTSGKQGSVP